MPQLRHARKIIYAPTETFSQRVLALVSGQPSWMVDAVCTVNPDNFDIPHGLHGKRRKEKIEKAKAICAGCPVLTECESWAESLQKKSQRTNNYAERWQWNDIVVAGKYYPPHQAKKTGED